VSRKKKATTTPAEAQTPLTVEDVFNVLQFANLAYSGGLWQGVLTPDLVNSRMRDISLSPLVATSETVATALQNPKESEDQLSGFVQWQELISMLFKRIL